jgi:hypothetical protein
LMNVSSDLAETLHQQYYGKKGKHAFCKLNNLV